MATNVIIKEGSGINVIPIDAFIQKVTTNDSTVNLEPNTFYELGSGTLQTLNLPTIDKDGDVIGIGGIGAGLFKIVQIAGEQILFGITPTTSGATGTLESTQINSVLYLRRLAAPGLYLASTPQGEFLIDAAGAAILNNAINNIVGGGALEIGFVNMVSTTVSDGWTGRTFAFTDFYKELTPALATYFTDNTANFTHTVNGQLQYTGPTKRFSISSMYCTEDESRLAGVIAVNGTRDLNSESYSRGTSSVIFQFSKVLNTNDIVSVHAKRVTSTNKQVLSFSLKIVG